MPTLRLQTIRVRPDPVLGYAGRMVRWMWYCVVVSLTLVLAASWLLPRPQRVSVAFAQLSAVLPKSACPPRSLEADGVCIPVPDPDPQGADGTEPAAPPLLTADLLPVAGAQRWAPLEQAPVPSAWRVPGTALAVRPVPGAPVACPGLAAWTILVQEAAAGWLVLAAPPSPNGAVTAVLVAGLATLSPELATRGTCSQGQLLGTARDQVVLSARRMPSAWVAGSTPVPTWFNAGSEVDLQAALSPKR